jgi:hypothetical protein
MAETPETGRPKSTLKIERTITNAPIPDDEELEAMTEGKRSPKSSKKSAAVADDETPEDEFASSLQDHTVRIHVDRVSPREWRGKQIGGMIEEYVPPITVEEIETDLRNRFGGGRYRVRVLKNGRFVSARGISVYGDPKIAEDEFSPDLQGDFSPDQTFSREALPGGPPIQDDEIGDLRKQIEKERLKKVLDEVKGNPNLLMARPSEDPEKIRREVEDRLRKEMEMRRELDGVKSDLDKKMSDFMSNMEKLLRSQKETDPARDSDIVSLDNKIERFKTEVLGEVKSVFGELRQTIQAMNAQPKQDVMVQLLPALIDGLTKMAGSSETKLQVIAQAENAKTQSMLDSMRAMSDAQLKVTQAQTDKVVAVMQNQGGGGIGEMSKSVMALRDMAEVMGWVPSTDTGGEPPDAMSRIVAMVEKALPSILAANAQKAKQTGQQLNQPEISQIIAQQAKAAAQQYAVPLAEQMVQKRLIELGYIPKPALPSPVVQAVPQIPATQTGTSSASPVVVTPMAAPAPVPTPVPVPPPVVQDPPVPHHAVASQAQEQAAPAPVAAVPNPAPEGDIFREKCDIVNNCMELLVREIRIRPRKPEWNEAAFEELPEDVLDQLVMVTDGEGLLRVIKPYAKQEYIKSIEEVLGDSRVVEWFVNGLNALKTMYHEDTLGGNSGPE